MMVAYSFQKRFAPLILEGLKTQTIRADRKRHARPGELLQLFTGMRTAHCARIVPDVTCTAVLPISIDWASARISRVAVGAVPVRNLDHFAVLDGFADLDDMTGFWLENHGARTFSGVVIEWARPSREAVLS